MENLRTDGRGQIMAVKSFIKIHKFLIFLLCILVLVAGLILAADNNESKKSEANIAPASEPQEPAKAESFVIKMDVDLVTLDATVQGNPVSELKADDFVIYDNEVAQDIDFYSRDQAPIAIAIVIDASQTAKAYLPMLQLAAFTTLRRLKPEDQVCLFSFNLNAFKMANLTDDRIEISEKIGKIKTEMYTNVFDTIYNAASYLKSEAPDRRRAVILVSDNCHWMSGHTTMHGKQSCLSKYLETNTTLYGLKMPLEMELANAQINECAEGNSAIDLIAKQTGGMFVDVNSATAIQEGLEKVIRNLREQYTLGFNPSIPGEKGSYHKLSIKFKDEKKCPGCRIFARSGYYAGVKQPPPIAKAKEGKKKENKAAQNPDELIIQRAILTAASFDKDMEGIRFAVKPIQQNNASGQAEVKINVSIPSSNIKFIAADSKHSCKLRIAIVYAKESGKIIGSDVKTVEGSIDDDKFQRVLEGGYSYSTTIRMKEPVQLIKVVVLDELSDKIGTRILLVQQGYPSS
jgi:Ca-activated chloride channel family protein